MKLLKRIGAVLKRGVKRPTWDGSPPGISDESNRDEILAVLRRIPEPMIDPECRHYRPRVHQLARLLRSHRLTARDRAMIVAEIDGELKRSSITQEDRDGHGNL